MGGIVWRGFGHCAGGSAGAGFVSGKRASGAMDQAGAEAREVSGIAVADLLAGVWRARQVWIGIERFGGKGRVEGANCDWARSSRLWVGGVALSRDGIDEGWVGCDCGLAAAQCAGEYGERGFVGFDS